MSNELRRRLFANPAEEARALTVPLTWCWVVPVLAVMLWIDIGQTGWRSISPSGRELPVAQAGLVVSNGVAAEMPPSEHSVLNHLPDRTFASTKMTVSPSTNPPPSRVTHSPEVR